MTAINYDPAYPLIERHDPGQRFGLTKRELAAIHLRVPKSGDDDIDAMIRDANRRDAAAIAMQGMLSDSESAGHPWQFAKWAADQADALIAELSKETP